jgi:hypothetical protein
MKAGLDRTRCHWGSFQPMGEYAPNSQPYHVENIYSSIAEPEPHRFRDTPTLVSIRSLKTIVFFNSL